MGKFFTQLGAVLYKSFLLKKKTPITTLIELFLPLVILVCFVLLAKQNESQLEMFQGIYDTLLFLLLSFNLSRLIGLLVMERENRVREMMKILSLSDLCFYFSWYLFYAILMLVVCITICPTAVFGGLLPDSSSFTLFVFYFSFCLSSISFSMLVSAPFNSARVSQSVGFLIYYCIGQIQWAIDDSWPSSVISLVCFLFPQIGFGLGLRSFPSSGLTWQTWSTTTSSTSGTSVSIETQTIYFLISSVMYFILFAYIDQIIPHTVGVKKHFLFPIGKCVGASSRSTNLLGSACTVSTHELSKQYGSKTVLTNVSLEMQIGEMSILLGENGAGKTTLINILTGMTEKSSGSISVFGI